MTFWRTRIAGIARISGKTIVKLLIWRQAWLKSVSQRHSRTSSLAQVVARNPNFVRRDGKWFPTLKCEGRKQMFLKRIWKKKFDTQRRNLKLLVGV